MKTLKEHYNLDNLDFCHEDDKHYFLEYGVPSSTEIRVICPIHGEFRSKINSYLRSDGKGTHCPACSKKSRSAKLKKGRFLSNSYDLSFTDEVHPDDLHFLTDEGVSSHTLIRFICPTHGEYKKSIKDYYRSDAKRSRCPACGLHSLSKCVSAHRRSLRELNDYYKYPDLSILTDHYRSLFLDNKLTSGDQVECVCPKHGIFTKRIADLYGSKKSGCPSCAKEISAYGSRLEIFLRNYLNDLGIYCYKSVIPNSPYELDIYIPEFKIGIEINGSYWHSDVHLDAVPKSVSGRMYHKLKTDLCEKEGIQLLHFHYWELENKWDICVNKILSLCNKLNRSVIYARRCKVVIVSSDERKDFLNLYHIQGDYPSLTYGLVYNNRLVSVMGWRKCASNTSESGSWELNRYASVPDIFVVGGFSKLESHFLKDHLDVKRIISFADRRISKGDFILS